MRNVRSIVCILLLSLCGGLLFAQSDRATISGTVQDPSGAVLPDVQVQVTNVGTNDVLTVKTNSAGLYTVKNLPIGSYAITYTKNGFRKLERKGITLAIGQEAGIDVTLQIGAQTESVIVTAEAPVLQTETPNLTTNLDNKAVSELPLNVSGGRDISKFMFAFIPGVEGDDYSSHINGSVAMSKEVLIDGSSAIAQIGGYIGQQQPPMEGVQEFQVESAGISADAGRTGGGIFRYEMKSGTNQWHGSLVGFMHSASLDALSVNNKLSAQQNPVDAAAYLKKSETMSDWGGSFGGPIIKNKLFFFAAFERYMQSNWNLGAPDGTVPTDAMMGMDANGNWLQNVDLSNLFALDTIGKRIQIGTDGAGNPIYRGAVFNPATGNTFVNNQIPVSLLSPVSQQILQLYHKYYAPQGAAGRQKNNAMPASNMPWNHINESSIKLDYNVSDKHRIYGSFVYNFFPRILADQGGIWSPNAPNGGPLANSYEHDTKSPSMRLADSYNFSPNVINSFRFAFNRFKNPSIATSQKGDWSNTLGLGDGIGNFPRIQFYNGMYNAGCCVENNGWLMGGMGSQFNDFYAGNTFIYNDDVTWVKGRHTMKFGAEFRAMQFNTHGDEGTYSANFDPATTAGAWYNIPGGAGWQAVGSAYASFLLGLVNDGGYGEPNWTYGRRKAFSVYASDNIKVNSKLTVNLDLRWDYNNPYKEKYGHWSNFNIRKLNSVTGLMGTMEYLTSGDQSFEKNQYWYNFAPHLGVAYAVTPKTVVRGTFSIFYVPLNMNTWGAIPYGFNPGFHESNAASAFNWNNGYVGTVTQVQTPDYRQWSAVYVDPRALMPGNTQQFTIGVQRELTKDTKLDLSYIQSGSYHLQSGTLETNQPTVADLKNYLTTGAFPASYNGYYAGQGPGYTGLLPYPQVAVGYGPLFTVGAPLGNSTYKSLQLSVTRRAAHGLSLQGSYNYSRTRGDVDTSFEELWWAGDIQNIYDLKNERKGIAGFDMAHIVKGYVLYELPFGRGKWIGTGANSVTNAFIGNWTVNFGYHYNTGTPMKIHAATSYPGFGSVYVNLVPGCKLTTGDHHIGAMYLNESCFQSPTGGDLGTAGNYIESVRNPGFASEDMALHKGLTFGPGEKYNLTLRLEFYNIFNRHQAGSPVTNMNDPNFGKVLKFGDLGGRVGQFGARFTF